MPTRGPGPARAQCLVSPVRWARYGRGSQWLAQFTRPADPPVLVLSLGRSGSTWVGATLGLAANALYLHEPLTQPLLFGGGQATNFDVDPRHPPPQYQAWARAAFSGWPAFPTSPRQPTVVVRYPKQWSLLGRHRRHVVVKEINPFACQWLVEEFGPRVIYLVRHPAAVALSNDRLGFLPGDDIWRRQGEHQGRAHQLVLDCLQTSGAKCTVLYEELCASPQAEYRRLFTFAGLDWSPAIEEFISTNTSGGDHNNPWAINRDSRKMIRDWAGKIEPRALDALRSAYARFELPWYQADAEWEPAHSGS